MSNLQTVRLKPNPTGKDRTRYGASAKQLGAEWADIQNVSSQAIDLTGVSVKHVAYSADGRTTRWEQVDSFKGTLQPGKTMRIHAGSGPVSVLNPDDLSGADFHFFTGGNYVWNNDKADCVGLFLNNQGTPFDKACYATNPPEGAILKRVGDAFVSSTAATTSARR